MRKKERELQKRVWDLEREIEEKDWQIRHLERDNKTYRDIIEKLQPERSHTQTNVCKRGPWCKACTFRESHMMSPYSDRIELCMKHMACEEFTPVKESSND